MARWQAAQASDHAYTPFAVFSDLSPAWPDFARPMLNLRLVSVRLSAAGARCIPPLVNGQEYATTVRNRRRMIYGDKMKLLMAIDGRWRDEA